MAICVGNSLALAPDMATVERSIRQMLAAVRDGGAIVVQVLNLWRLADGPCQWQKCRRAALPSDSLILKGVHRSGNRGYVDLIVTDLFGEPAIRSESTPFLGLDAADLDRMAKAAGATKIAIFGGYQDQPYERQQSVDLVVILEKATP